MNLKILKFDITALEVDAVVNAANSTLLGGGGVDGAIHRGAGPELLEACKKIRLEQFPDGLPIGQVVATKAFNLKANLIIHTVGPIHGKDDIMLLKSCYENSLKLAEKLNCNSIAFPAISTGAYGVPIETSATMVKRVLDDYRGPIETIMLVLFSTEDLEVYEKIFKIPPE